MTPGIRASILQDTLLGFVTRSLPHASSLYSKLATPSRWPCGTSAVRPSPLFLSGVSSCKTNSSTALISLLTLKT